MSKAFLILLALLVPLVSSATEEERKPVNKTLVWPDGTRYVGGVIDGKRAGKGTIFWQDGTRFVGQFVDDMRNGPGTMILPDGTVYTGFFKDDELVDSPAESSITSVASEVDPLKASNLPDDESGAMATADIQPIIETSISSTEGEQVVELQAIAKDEPITELTDETRQQLVETVDLWGAAWSDKNVPQYLSNYSKDFVVPGKLSRKSWEGFRRTRLRQPKYIRITIDYEKFEIAGPDTADVYFKQTYHSNTYSDVTNKMLRLRKEDHAWMILSEQNR